MALEEAHVLKEAGSTPGHVAGRLAHLDGENDSRCSATLGLCPESDGKCQAGDFPTFPSSPSLTMREGSSCKVLR